MTMIYKCDRCHKQFTDDVHMTKVVISNEYTGTHTYHYCIGCSTILLNAVHITNNGTYRGSTIPGEKIGKLLSLYSDIPVIPDTRG